jgi:hypothetical protein
VPPVNKPVFLENFRETRFSECGRIKDCAALFAPWASVVVKASGADRPEASKLVPFAWVVSTAEMHTP